MLSKLLAFDQRGNIIDQARTAFWKLAKEGGLADEMEPDEMLLYSQRFIDEIDVETNQAGGIKAISQEWWEGQMLQTLEDQKPPLTKLGVRMINKAGLGWTAELPAYMMNISVKDMRTKLNGLKPPPEER